MSLQPLRIGLSPAWMVAVLKKVGVKGSVDEANEIPTDQVKRMLKDVGAKAITWQGPFASHPFHVTHWCAAFANQCLEESNIKGTGSAAAASFIGWGTTVFVPQFGTICVLRRTGGHHVAFYIETLSNGRLSLVGGNQSKHHQVCFGSFDPKDVLLNGYRWPKFLANGQVQQGSLSRPANFRP